MLSSLDGSSPSRDCGGPGTSPRCSRDNPYEVEQACRGILTDNRCKEAEVGVDRVGIREWSGKTMVDFKRARRKVEKEQRVVGGLPSGDSRQQNKKAYGES